MRVMPDALQLRRVAFIVALALLLAACGGPSQAIYTTGSVLTKTVTTTGSVAGKTAFVAGKVATTTATTAVKTGVNAAAGIAKSAVVTFIDSSTGVAKQLPYAEGMKLYAASEMAKVNLALKSIQILRGSQVFTASSRDRKPGTDIPLQPGDVIKFASLASK